MFRICSKSVSYTHLDVYKRQVWFPALWPETYSYTLSACLESGMPVVAPNIGAFAERLQGRRWTWLADWQQSSETWLAFFESIKDRHFSTGISPDPIETAPCDMNTKSAAVSYHGNYLAELPAPQACTRSGLCLLYTSRCV